MSKEDDELRRLVGRRFAAARRSGGLRTEDIAGLIGHQGKTQISLIENGKRLPPFKLALDVANATGASLDYLAGRVDDPLADPLETNHGILVASVRIGVNSCFERFSSVVARQIAADMQTRSGDSSDLDLLLAEVARLQEAVFRFKARNEGFEDMPAGSVIDGASDRLSQLIKRIQARRAIEKRAKEQRAAMADWDVQLIGSDQESLKFQEGR